VATTGCSRGGAVGSVWCRAVCIDLDWRLRAGGVNPADRGSSFCCDFASFDPHKERKEARKEGEKYAQRQSDSRRVEPEASQP